MPINTNDTPTAGPSVPGSGYGLGDTIYSAIKRALGDMEGDSESGGNGGEESDFTTAQVTITYDNEDTENAGIMLPVAEEANPPFVPEASSSCIRFDYTPERPMAVILYKGKCITHYYGTGTVTTSGNVTYERHEIIITGDCSITIS